MPIQILYVPGTKLIVLFNEQCELKKEFFSIIDSSQNIEKIEISYFEKLANEEFLEFNGNNFISCKSNKNYFYSEVCSLAEIKNVLTYFKKLHEENDGDFFDILKGNWRSFIKQK